MRYLKNQKGFTLIELVMVIVILGILAAVAIPKFTDMSGDARAASEVGVVGGVRAGISTVYMSRIMKYAKGDTVGQTPFWYYPPKLDNHPSTPKNNTVAFFDSVLAQGGVQDGNWSQGASMDYTGPAGGIYKYYPITSGGISEGTFRKEP